MQVIGTLEHLVLLLGFKDLFSFFITSFFIILCLAFISAFGYALIKKRKERFKEIRKIVEEPIPPPKKEIVDEKQKLNKALDNTRLGFMAKLYNLFSKTIQISEKDFEEIESILFTADIGPKTVQKLLDNLKEKVNEEKNANPEFLINTLKEHMSKILKNIPLNIKTNGISPKVIMFVGVNGAGKTTTIGKLAYKFIKDGQKVVLGAGDTFRAAAVKQLHVWGERVGAKVVSGKENADSASVLFEAIKNAQQDEADLVLCDTAGRLHTKQGLMDELKKVYKVLQKAREGAPDEVLLVVDATMGQNAIMQAREFSEATPLTGIVISKLDGTAKGGVLLGIADELKIPIRYVGLGEKINDLEDFNADNFIEALFKK